MSLRARNRQQPSERDWTIWQQVKHDLVDWLYRGITGHFHIAGHRKIGNIAADCADKIVLEVGCGHGHHLRYGRNDYAGYVGLDIEYKFLCTLRERYPGTRVVNGDAYELPFRDESVDCVLSVYCFEHLRRLPVCLSEIWRVLKQEGELLVGLPAEGGLLYGIGRSLTSKPYMERKYGINYGSIVQWEHWNTCNEAVSMIRAQFKIREISYVPFRWLPTTHLNVLTCLRCCK
jgi:SAM-dependent methyltransferase